MLKSYPMRKNVSDAIKRIHEIFKSRGMTLSVAESCTGGLISHYITLFPGASAFFPLGIVSYSSAVKEVLLGVSHELIERYGVISEETAREMAERIRILSKSDISLSTTGNLGPDVMEEKDKGLVYIALSGQGRIICREFKLRHDRERNKEESAYLALKLLIEFMEGN